MAPGEEQSARVALNTWWNGDPDQRYWMEITDRPDLGGPLLSPKLPELRWGYDLVSQVQPGDRVLHWWTGSGRPGLYGWSEVAQHAIVIPDYTWVPRHGQSRTTAGWRAQLDGLHEFDPPVLAAALRPRLDAIVDIDTALGAEHRGTLYFPLTRYGANRPEPKQEIRAAQAYFVKFPAELFDVIDRIGAAQYDAPHDPVDVDLPEDFQATGKRAPAGRTTRSQDPAQRAAIERRSLDVCRAYYCDELGGTNYEEVGKPYDVRVSVDGTPRRVEVKGSAMEIDTVELTINEVVHANSFNPVDLVVVDRIAVHRDPATGAVTGASGGRRRVWPEWTPRPDGLLATRYAYTLPAVSDGPQA